MRSRWWLPLVSAAALAGGACSNGAASNGAGGGAGQGTAGAAGTLATGGGGQGGGGAGGGKGTAGSGATAGNGGAGGAAGDAGATGNTGSAGTAGVGGSAGGGGKAGASGSAGAGAGGAAAGGGGGHAAHLVTFAFTGHITSVGIAIDPTNGTTPQVGDPFTGSYTIDADYPLQGSGAQAAFLEDQPGIAADLEIHNVSYSLPIPGDRNYPFGYILLGPTQTECWIVVGYFAEPRTIPDLDYSAHMDFYWHLVNPTGPVPTAKDLTTVPPVVSDWTQNATAVSIELKGTHHADYVANGVIDTIVAR